MHIPPALECKTLLVCIGAAKCATSWLHAYLGAMPEIAVSPLKEVHFFNAGFPQNALSDVEALALSRLSFHLGQPGDPAANLRQRATFQASIDRAQMIYDDEAYFGHFARICTENTHSFCDITPAYSAIGRDGFARMRRFCDARGVRLKILFVMRDPVERFWSQIRHLEQLNPANKLTDRWPEALSAPALTARAVYQGIVTALDDLFPADDLLYLFYENLFDKETLVRLCQFAGAAFQAGNTTERLNATQLLCTLPDDAREALKHQLAPHYSFCRDRFGAEIPEGWQQ